MQLTILPDGSYHLGDIIVSPNIIIWLNWLQTGGTMGYSNQEFDNSGSKIYKKNLVKIIKIVARSVVNDNFKNKDVHQIIELATGVLVLLEDLDLPAEVMEQVNKH